MASRRVFKYRGFTINDLQTMSMDEFIQLLPSRQRRSLLRGMPENHIKLIEKISAQINDNRQKPIRTHCRDFIILPSCVGAILHVHNGKEFIRVNLRPETIGMYLGEFAPTHKSVRHSAPGIGATKSSQYVPLK